MIGADLKSLRQKLGFTIRESAAQCDVTERTWINYENRDGDIPEAVEKQFLKKNKVAILKLPARFLRDIGVDA